MSSNGVAIRVSGLSKVYQIGHEQEKHSTLAETMLARVTNPLKRMVRDEFWALKDVNFEVQKGDVVGIIGRNGAGKSTLLKVLSRITEPTKGKVELFGRVGSLLEVGTGFHPELTGRENVYLNGAILGMRRAEIARQFDAIVAFSEVEKFLDTPVKRYSSGMYVRLAFAVAAHLDPEILIVDEVLAVGDAQFQKKCLGKMQDVAGQGRTVLFVSHNMAAVEKLCSTAILMNHGQVLNHGATHEMLDQYNKKVLAQIAAIPLGKRKDRTGTGDIRLNDFYLETPEGKRRESVRSGEDVVFVFGYEARAGSGADVDIGLSLGYSDQHVLTVLYSSYMNQRFSKIGEFGEFRCLIRRLPVSAGKYRVGARIFAGNVEADWPRDGIADLIVDPGDYYGTGSSGFEGFAPMLMRGDWTVAEASAATGSDLRSL